MATSTENFKFKKPDESDFYDVQDQNGNHDCGAGHNGDVPCVTDVSTGVG